MGKTNIEWANYSWNPWMGCHKVSTGCKNCYMYRDMKRFKKDPNVVRRSKTRFNLPHSIEKSSLIFTCSWSDFFIEEADEWRDEAWEIIRQTPHLTYQILTKRIDNVPDRLPNDWGEGYDNVWLGVSIENQEFIHRAFALNKIPAKIRFVSAEPLLGEIYLKPRLTWYDKYEVSGKYPCYFHGIDWVIVGGESGPDYRPMKPKWAIDLASQCKNSEAKFYMKQMGGWPNKKGVIPPELQIFDYPEGEWSGRTAQPANQDKTSS